MPEHEFTLILPDCGPLDFAAIEAMMDAVGVDATVCSSGGLGRISFACEAPSRDEAIRSAIRQVARAGYAAELDESVEEADRKWAELERDPDAHDGGDRTEARP
jgi:hypothetical protein